MVGSDQTFVFVRGDARGGLTSEDKKLIRSRSKRGNYSRKKATTQSSKRIAHGLNSAEAQTVESQFQCFPVSPGIRDDEPSRSQRAVVRAADNMPSLPTLPRHLSFERFAGDLDPHAIGLLYSSSLLTPSLTAVEPLT